MKKRGGKGEICRIFQDGNLENMQLTYNFAERGSKPTFYAGVLPLKCCFWGGATQICMKKLKVVFYINFRDRCSGQSKCLNGFLIFRLWGKLTHSAEQTLLKLGNVKTKRNERNQPLFSSQQMIRRSKVSLLWSYFFVVVNNATVPGLQGLLLNYAHFTCYSRVRVRVRCVFYCLSSEGEQPPETHNKQLYS